MAMTGGYFIGIIGVVAFCLLIFLILRAVMLWYWKINDIVSKLDAILNELRKANAIPQSLPKL